MTILVTIALVALLAFTAWATETGRILSTRNQLQSAADSAALAGAGSLLANNNTVVDPTAARAAAQNYGAQHYAGGVTLQIPNADIVTGSWDLATRIFTPQPGSVDPNVVRAVRVRSRRDATANGPLPAIFGHVVGLADFSVGAAAVGYIGWAGTAGPGLIDLPIVIDCCAISGSAPGSACTQNYCQTIQSGPPNPCPRELDGVSVTCLEFASTPEQNACWSEMSPTDPAVNSPDLQDIVQDGNPITVGDEPIYLDNGTKTPVVDEIYDRFHGEGNYSGNPSGIDTRPVGALDGVVDSWVLSLPVVECQNPGDNCASGDGADIVGFVCFDLQEVEVTPDKIIRGQFLCTSDPRCQGPGTGLGPGGTVPGTFSAQYPVLVQ